MRFLAKTWGTETHVSLAYIESQCDVRIYIMKVFDARKGRSDIMVIVQTNYNVIHMSYGHLNITQQPSPTNKIARSETVVKFRSMPELHKCENALLSLVDAECGGISHIGCRCTARHLAVWGRQEVPQRHHRALSLRTCHIHLAFHTRISIGLRCAHLQQIIKSSIYKGFIFLSLPIKWLKEQLTAQPPTFSGNCVMQLLLRPCTHHL